MAKTPTSNYGNVGVSPAMVWAGADTDQFARTDVSSTAQTIENHDHTLGKGLAAGRLNSSNALTNQGDVFINVEAFTFKGASNNHTVATLDSNQTWTGLQTYSGAASIDASGITSENHFKVPVIAGAVPTQSGTIEYDSTSNTLKAGVNGVTESILALGGGQTVSVANGGTGRATLTTHSVIVGEGTSAVGQVGPGTSGLPLVANGAGADPSFQTISSSAIANGSITSSQLAAGASLANIGAGGLTSTYIATNTITADKLSLMNTTNAVVSTSAGQNVGWVRLGSITVDANALVLVIGTFNGPGGLGLALGTTQTNPPPNPNTAFTGGQATLAWIFVTDGSGNVTAWNNYGNPGTVNCVITVLRIG